MSRCTRSTRPQLLEAGTAAKRVDVEGFLRRVKLQAQDAESVRRALRLPRDHRVLNVHAYGWSAYEAFVRAYYSDGRPRILALSMNPGPFGAVQTGIPFCDVPLARQLLPGFDRLIAAKPSWVASERREISALKLVVWSDARFGGIRGLYARVLLAMTCPLAILRGPRKTNVPLPALPRREQEKIEAFIPRHAAEEIRLAEPAGILMLGEWAQRVWRIALRTDPGLASLPALAAPHPAAHITNRAKYAAWTRAWQRFERAATPKS